MNIAFTWHRDEQFYKTLKKNNILYKDFVLFLEEYLIKNFDKQNDIFFVWGSDWFDNIVWWLLAKNNYKYILKLSEKDKNMRNYWNNFQKKLFKKVYDNAYKIDIIEWSYIKRDEELIKNANILIAFIDDKKIMKSWTWTTINLFLKYNYSNNMTINNIYNNFLKIIKSNNI